MKLKEKINNNKLYGIGISLIMAIFLWMWVIGVENPEIEMPFRGIDVKYEGLDYLKKEGLSVISPENPKVNIYTKGTKLDLNNKIDSHNFEVILDLKALKPGENKVPVEYSLLGQTGSVRISKVEPSNILVTIDEIVSENKKITIETLGELPSSYTLGNVRALNTYVRVTGPSSELSKIDKVVSYADITGKTESFMITSKIIFLDKNGIELKNIDSNSENVELEIPIYKIKSVPIKLNTFGSLNENQYIKNLSIIPESVVIRGNTDSLDKVKEISTEAININSLVTNEKFYPKLSLPAGVSLHENVELKLKYDYIKNIDKNFEIDKTKIKIENKNSVFNYEIDDSINKIIINLMGEEKYINSLDLNNLNLSLNVIDLKEGEHLVDLYFQPINAIEIKSIEPSKIKVKISQKTNIEENLGETDNNKDQEENNGEINPENP